MARRGSPPDLPVTPETGGTGVVVEAVRGKGYENIGWLRDYSEELLEALHVVECLLRSPASLALFLQAASFESLEPAGGITAGRVFCPDRPVDDRPVDDG